MSANGNSADLTPLRHYGATIVRERPVLELRAGAMDGRVVITPLKGFRDGAIRFEVGAHWHGPGLEGLPPADEADVSDALVTADLELARAIAMAAIDDLRALRAPDLRALFRRFEPTE